MSERKSAAGEETVGSQHETDGRDALQAVDPERYTLEEQIGEGGLGRLVRARDRRLDRIVAIKLMRRISTKLEARFRREAEITARLQHPGIVPIHEAGRWLTGEPYYAMRLIAGASLKEVFAERKGLDARLPLLRAILSVCEAIGYAHSERVIHRDLKPANVMIGSFGEAIVIDWGLAKIVDAAELPGDDDVASAGDATCAGTIVGTPAYMPPEQAGGGSLDRRADVYALGAVLYELLAGRAPYEGASSVEVTGAVLAGPPTSLTSLAPGVPRELVAIVDKAMARDPAARYGDGSALADDLRRFLDGQLVAAHHYSRGQRLARFWRRHRAILTVASASIAALLVFGAYSVRRIVGERRAAELARAQAEGESAHLLLAQARLWLDRDPTVAVAWLKKYARTASPDGDEIAALAATARARGAARQRVLDRKRVVLAQDGHTLAAVSDDQLVVWTLEDATPHSLGKLEGSVAALAFSADARTVYAASGGRLRAWPVAGGSARELLAGGEPIVQVLAGRGTIIAGGERGTLWLIDAASGAVRAFPGHGSPVNDLVPSSDGSVVLSHTKANEMRVWRLPDGESRLPAMNVRAPDSKHATLSSDGSHLAWGDDKGVVYIVALETGVVRSLHGHVGQVQRVAFSADGHHLASSCADSTVRVWDLSTGTARVLTGHTNWSQRLAFSPDGKRVASSALDRTIRVWDLATGDAQLLRGHNSTLILLRFTPDGRDLVVGDTRGEVRVWPVARPIERVLHTAPGASVFLQFLRDGSLLAAGDDAVLVQFGDEGNVLRRTSLPLVMSSVGLPEAAFEDGSRLAIGNGDGKLVIVDLKTGEAKRFPGHEGPIYDLTLSHDGKRIVTAGSDHTVRLWDVETGTQRVLGKHALPVWHAIFSPDERTVASAGDDLDLRLWNIADGSGRTLSGHTAIVYQLEFSPDGKLLASGGTDATLRLWNVEAPGGRVLVGHGGVINSIQFSPDGRHLASASDDGTVRSWNLATGQARVLEHASGVAVVRFLGDGATLATGASDGAVRVWDTDRGSLRALFPGGSTDVIGLAPRDDGRRIAAAYEDGAIRVWSDPGLAPRAPATAAELEALGTIELVGSEAISRSGK